MRGRTRSLDDDIAAQHEHFGVHGDRSFRQLVNDVLRVQFAGLEWFNPLQPA